MRVSPRQKGWKMTPPDERRMHRRFQPRRKLTCEAEGYTVQEVERGADAVRAAADFQPDIVLLDLMMPDQSGFDTCRELRRTGYRMPVVILSGQDDVGVTAELMAAGAVDYITKDSLRPARVLESLARAGIAVAPR